MFYYLFICLFIYLVLFILRRLIFDLFIHIYMLTPLYTYIFFGSVWSKVRQWETEQSIKYEYVGSIWQAWHSLCRHRCMKNVRGSARPRKLWTWWRRGGICRISTRCHTLGSSTEVRRGSEGALMSLATQCASSKLSSNSSVSSAAMRPHSPPRSTQKLGRWKARPPFPLPPALTSCTLNSSSAPQRACSTWSALREFLVELRMFRRCWGNRLQHRSMSHPTSSGGNTSGNPESMSDHILRPHEASSEELEDPDVALRFPDLDGEGVRVFDEFFGPLIKSMFFKICSGNCSSRWPLRCRHLLGLWHSLLWIRCRRRWLRWICHWRLSTSAQRRWRWNQRPITSPRTRCDLGLISGPFQGSLKAAVRLTHRGTPCRHWHASGPSGSHRQLLSSGAGIWHGAPKPTSPPGTHSIKWCLRPKRTSDLCLSPPPCSEGDWTQWLRHRLLTTIGVILPGSSTDCVTTRRRSAKLAQWLPLPSRLPSRRGSAGHALWDSAQRSPRTSSPPQSSRRSPFGSSAASVSATPATQNWSRVDRVQANVLHFSMCGSTRFPNSRLEVSAAMAHRFGTAFGVKTVAQR